MACGETARHTTRVILSTLSYGMLFLGATMLGMSCVVGPNVALATAGAKGGTHSTEYGRSFVGACK